jgi:2-oxoglutarate ferredoxin oxidoreductase subunit beta
MIFINNGIYGMTGGQMAPTTLPGMKTATSPFGRDISTMGNPLKMTELVAHLPGTYFVTRQAVHTPSAVRKTKRAVKMAFENQLNKVPGVSFVEIVSNCNSGWKMTPVDANIWMEENMFPYYEMGDIKVAGKLIEKK